MFWKNKLTCSNLFHRPKHIMQYKLSPKFFLKLMQNDDIN